MGWCAECDAEGRDPHHTRTVFLGQCPRHYAREYRRTAEGRRATREANARWQRRWWKELDEQERYEHRRARGERRHEYVPLDVHDLRDACKRLEGALAFAGNRARLRESSELSGYVRSERGDRPGRGEDLRVAGAGDLADGLGGSDEGALLEAGAGPDVREATVEEEIARLKEELGWGDDDDDAALASLAGD